MPPLPVMMLASALPVPSMAPVPVRVRFSTSAARACEIDRRLDRVDAGAAVGDLVDDVAGIVDDVGVVAGAADQRVGAGAAVEDVGGGVAGDDVGQRVAGAVDRRRAGQRQVLERRQPSV